MVVKPSEVEGQSERVFGHFPNGGVVFNNHIPAFKSRSGFLSAKKATENKGFQLVKYRAGSSVEIWQGTRFVTVGDLGDSLFSINRKLTVGGTNGGCDFQGAIAEILVFGEILAAKDDIIFSNYLMHKWKSILVSSFKPVICVDNGDISQSIRIWNPPLNTTTASQRNEWKKLLYSESLTLKRASKMDKKVLSTEIEHRLKQSRFEIFGAPCKKESQPVVKQSNLDPLPLDTATSSTPETKKKKSCVRPFTNAILDWQPPTAASRSSKDEWNDAIRNTKREISKLLIGGQELIQILNGYSRHLNAHRDIVFAGICDDDVPSVKFQKLCSTAEIISWKPPTESTADSKSQWGNTIVAAKSKISKFTRGGAELNQFLTNTIRDLEQQRYNLFKTVCDNI